MSYVAVGHVHGGDVEDMLQFCDLISWEKKPYHTAFLEQELLKRVRLWPRYLYPMQITELLESTYKMALQKHGKLKSAGPKPNRIRCFGPDFRMLRYRPHNLNTVITLDMARVPALLSVQGYFPYTVQKYAEKAHIGPVVAVEDNKVLFPSEILNFQLSLGTVLQLLDR